MRGRICTLLLTLMVVAVLLSTAVAAPYEPPAATSSRPVITSAQMQPFPIGPVDALERTRQVYGVITMFARPPKETTIAAAEFFIDGKSVGKSTERPYKLDYDTSNQPNGDHILKAVGLDAKGSEVWSASSKAVFTVAPAGGQIAAPGANAMPPAGERPLRPRPQQTPEPSAASDTPFEMPAQPPTAADPLSDPPAGERPRATTPKASKESTALAFTKVYNNPVLSFSISYPQVWIALDKTAEMEPAQKGNAWVVFGTEPLDKAGLVVNVKRMQLEASTDVDTFAKYNSYVKSWKRTALLGSSAFVTTDGKPENRRVIHRAIIIKDGCAWMMNCIDTTGKPAAESKKIFDSMINTLSTLKPVQPNVTITESKGIS